MYMYNSLHITTTLDYNINLKINIQVHVYLEIYVTVIDTRYFEC